MGRLLTRSIVPALALLLAAISLGACGAEEEEKEGLFEGEPVELGSVEWNVLFSRRLNPSDIEDREYLEGQPPPGADSTYLGIFVQVENHNEDEEESLPPELTIVDTEGEEYTSIESESPYALHLDTPIPAGDEVPALDSTPQVGPIQGSMVLFLVPDQAFENRPLELEIPGQDGPATIELDL